MIAWTCDCGYDRVLALAEAISLIQKAAGDRAATIVWSCPRCGHEQRTDIRKAMQAVAAELYEKEMIAMSDAGSKTPTAGKDPSFAESAKTFTAMVAYRTAAIQLTKRMRGLLADALTHHLKGKVRATKRRMVLDLLDGPAGGPLVALLLSGLLPQAAGLIGQNGDKVGRLSEELRLHAGVTVASDLLDGLFMLLGPAKEALGEALSGLPDFHALKESGGETIFEAEIKAAERTGVRSTRERAAPLVEG